ncbi:DUF86 domain-containing protein [bacterium]|nr:DUF86 domain-containing protein [bacterium]
MKREYKDYLADILESINDISEFTKEMSLEEFKKDKKTINAVVRSLEIIGESSNKIPIEIRKEYPELPWGKVIGMRNKLIHEYFGIDLEILWSTIKKNIPPLKNIIQKMLDS